MGNKSCALPLSKVTQQKPTSNKERTQTPSEQASMVGQGKCQLTTKEGNPDLQSDILYKARAHNVGDETAGGGQALNS